MHFWIRFENFHNDPHYLFAVCGIICKCTIQNTTIGAYNVNAINKEESFIVGTNSVNRADITKVQDRAYVKLKASNILSLTTIVLKSTQQESPPARMQEAYRPPRSKYRLCCSGRGYPPSRDLTWTGGAGGYLPCPLSWDLTWMGGTYPALPLPRPPHCPGIWPGQGGTHPTPTSTPLNRHTPVKT